MKRKAYLVIDSDMLLDFKLYQGYCPSSRLTHDVVFETNVKTTSVSMRKSWLKGVRVDATTYTHLEDNPNREKTKVLCQMGILPYNFFNTEDFKRTGEVALLTTIPEYKLDDYYSAKIIPNGYAVITLGFGMMLVFPIETFSGNIDGGTFNNEQAFLEFVVTRIYYINQFDDFSQLKSTAEMCKQMLLDKFGADWVLLTQESDAINF